MKKLALFVSLAAVLTVMVGCSALDKLNKSKNGTPAFDLSGSWEVVATSTVNPGVLSVVEFNATQDSGGGITVPAQEFIFGTSATVLGNCYGVIPGNPQGNVQATVDSKSITGTYTEMSATTPQQIASFSIQAPLASATTFSGNFSGTAPGCTDGGTFVATKTTSLSGSYAGQLTYPDAQRKP